MDMRAVMPETAKRIDEMRSDKGAEAVNELIRRAMAGEPYCFYAEENGLTFGARDTESVSVIYWDEQGKMHRTDPAWMVEALQLAEDMDIEIVRIDVNDPDDNRRVARKLREVMAQHQAFQIQLIEANNGR